MHTQLIESRRIARIRHEQDLSVEFLDITTIMKVNSSIKFINKALWDDSWVDKTNKRNY